MKINPDHFDRLMLQPVISPAAFFWLTPVFVVAYLVLVVFAAVLFGLLLLALGIAVVTGVLRLAVLWMLRR